MALNFVSFCSNSCGPQPLLSIRDRLVLAQTCKALNQTAKSAQIGKEKAESAQIGENCFSVEALYARVRHIVGSGIYPGEQKALSFLDHKANLLGALGLDGDDQTKNLVTAIP